MPSSSDALEALLLATDSAVAAASAAALAAAAALASAAAFASLRFPTTRYVLGMQR